jgi:hypothetical protein
MSKGGKNVTKILIVLIVVSAIGLLFAIYSPDINTGKNNRQSNVTTTKSIQENHNSTESQSYKKKFETRSNEANFTLLNITTINKSRYVGKTLYVEYYAESTKRKNIKARIGRISGIYSSLINNGWEVNRMEAVAVNNTKKSLFSYTVQSYWVRLYYDGVLSTNEMSDRIINTVEQYPNPANESRKAFHSKFSNRTSSRVNNLGDEIIVQNGDTTFYTYSIDDGTEYNRSNEIGSVAILYAKYIKEGWGTQALEVTVKSNSERSHSYRIDSKWAKEYANGQMNLSKYLELISDGLYDYN